jgi:phage N-6-adenine-methyltransferase
LTIMPAQRPHRSEQTVETPKDFLDAIAARFGRLDFDLACTKENAKAPRPVTSGSLELDWSQFTGNLWLNPPYTDLGAWASKCRSESIKSHKWNHILLLTPASVGSNWWSKHVDGQAAVYFLSPRLTFVGHSSSYPKDLALSVYGEKPVYECWRWKK